MLYLNVDNYRTNIVYEKNSNIMLTDLNNVVDKTYST